MTAPAISKPEGKGWATKYNLTSVGDIIGRFGSAPSSSSPKVAKKPPKVLIYAPRLETAADNSYHGRFGAVHDAIVIPKRKPLVITLIPNPPRMSRRFPNSQSFPSENSSGVDRYSDMAGANYIEQAVDGDILTLNGVNPVAQCGSSPVAEHTTSPVIHNLQASGNDLSTPVKRRRRRKSDWALSNIPREFDHLPPLPNPPTKPLPALPAGQLPYKSTEPLTKLPRGLRADYIRVLWERDLLRNSPAAPSVISVPSIDTTILDRISMVGSFVSPDTEVDESVLLSLDSFIETPTVYTPSVSSAVTAIYSPQTDAATPSSPEHSDSTCIYKEQIYAASSSTYSTPDHSSSFRAMQVAFQDVEALLYPVASAEKMEATRAWPLCVGNQDDYFNSADSRSLKSDTFSLFGEGTPGCWAGEPEPQVDIISSQKIGTATSCDSKTEFDKYGEEALELAFCALRATLPPFADGMNGWQLLEEDSHYDKNYNEHYGHYGHYNKNYNEHYDELTIENENYSDTTPLLEASRACTLADEFGSEAMERAFKDVEDLLHPIVNGEALESDTMSTLPKKSDQVHLPVENDSPKSTAPAGTSFAPTITRWIRHLKGKKGTKGEQQQTAKRERWNLTKESKAKK